MIAGQTVGFRVPKRDVEFVAAFNLAVQATGVDLSTLAMAALRHGLSAAVAHFLDSQEDKERMRQEAQKQLLAKIKLPAHYRQPDAPSSTLNDAPPRKK